MMSVAYKYSPRYTVADYQRWEGDWELFDGVAIDMGPSPFGPHGAVLSELTYLFKGALKQISSRALEVLVEIDWVIDQHTVVRPDLAMVPTPLGAGHILRPPVLVAEVISRSTAEKDRTAKFELYQQQAVEYYLIADPDDQQLEVYRLIDGVFQLQVISTPFVFEINGRCSLSVDFSGLF